jgi:hypothetical protein
LASSKAEKATKEYPSMAWRDTIEDHVSHLEKVYKHLIEELKRQRIRCKIVADKVVEQHGEEVAKRF